jgi:GNAT superfamily N-acetyltransferase
VTGCREQPGRRREASAASNLLGRPTHRRLEPRRGHPHRHASRHLCAYRLPDAVVAKLPRYAAIPAVLIGRLAVSASFQRRKLGSVLLADAVSRTARADIATFAVLADPKDDAAQRFYRHHGFLDLPPDRRMFIPIESALRFFRSH